MIEFSISNTGIFYYTQRTIDEWIEGELYDIKNGFFLKWGCSSYSFMSHSWLYVHD